jgi:hypothetical protein
MHLGKRLANLLRELVHAGIALSRQPLLMRLERLHALRISSRPLMLEG